MARVVRHVAKGKPVNKLIEWKMEAMGICFAIRWVRISLPEIIKHAAIWGTSQPEMLERRCQAKLSKYARRKRSVVDRYFAIIIARQIREKYSDKS